MVFNNLSPLNPQRHSPTQQIYHSTSQTKPSVLYPLKPTRVLLKIQPCFISNPYPSSSSSLPFQFSQQLALASSLPPVATEHVILSAEQEAHGAETASKGISYPGTATRILCMFARVQELSHKERFAMVDWVMLEIVLLMMISQMSVLWLHREVV